MHLHGLVGGGRLAARDDVLQLLAELLSERAVYEQVDGGVQRHEQVGEQSLKDLN